MSKGVLNCGKLPGRKRPALYVEEAGVIKILAYFKGELEMARFLQYKPMYTPVDLKRGNNARRS